MAVERDAVNVIFPLKNTDQMVAQTAAIARASQTNTIDLQTEFGPNWKQGYYTVAADGAKLYIALGHTPGQISPIAPTGGTNGASGYSSKLACWPVPDEQERHFRVPVGREVGTGVALDADYRYLHYRIPSGGTTGMMRVYRSSVLENTRDLRRND